MIARRSLTPAATALVAVALIVPPSGVDAQALRVGGADAELTLARVGDRTVELSLAPLDRGGRPLPVPDSDILVDYPRDVLWSGRSVDAPVQRSVGDLTVEVSPAPLTITLRRPDGSVVQRLEFPEDGAVVRFRTPAPIFGLGHGGPQFDRRGHRHSMRDGWGAYERPTHGSRVASPLLIGMDGWSLFVLEPTGRGNVFDLRGNGGSFQWSDSAGARPVRLLLTAWTEPAQALGELASLVGRTPMPPRWALGYMQSHRTLEGPEQIVQVAQTFREKQLPIDAVIYLGTGFTPLGWNRRNGDYGFNPESFPDPERVIAQLHALDLKVVLHSYGPPIGLHGDTVGVPTSDSTHIAALWREHRTAIAAGADAWWPDGGENLSIDGRIARSRMYYAGPLASRPNVRPWALFRTGYTGVQRYGGWLWSGDVDSYWRTLETQIAVALNTSVSLAPFWGSDIGGFLPSEELTGELYVRWFQFATFTASFRAHGRGWHVRLPWGWNTSELGPPEVDRFSDAFASGYPEPHELRNGLVEPIVRQYLQLRYRLLPYTYTLARETHDTGVPPMRAMWLHYPRDSQAVRRGDQYLWGRDILVAPVHVRGATERTLYLPAGDWYDFWTSERLSGGREITRRVDLATLPLYVRAGAILPLDPVRQFTSQRVDEPTAIQIYPGADGEFRWYDDDGISLDHEGGAYSWTRLRWNDAGRRLTIERDPASGRPPAGATLRVKLMAPGATGALVRTIAFDGTRAEVVFP